MMSSTRFATVVSLAALLLVGGCASGPDSPADLQAQDPAPAWVGEAGKHSAGDVVGFVGVATADDPVSAIEQAERSALRYLARYVGARVSGTEVLVTRGEYRHSETADPTERIESRERLEVDFNSAGISFDHHGQQGKAGFTGWARAKVPLPEIERMKAEFRQEHERRLAEQEQIEEALIESRADMSDGTTPSLLRVSEQAEVKREHNESREAAERRAIRAAAHQARMELARGLAGESVSATEQTVEGQHYRGSVARAQGRVHSEVVGQRVRWADETVIGEATVLGWQPEVDDD